MLLQRQPVLPLLDHLLNLICFLHELLLHQLLRDCGGGHCAVTATAAGALLLLLLLLPPPLPKLLQLCV